MPSKRLLLFTRTFSKQLLFSIGTQELVGPLDPYPIGPVNDRVHRAVGPDHPADAQQLEDPALLGVVRGGADAAQCCHERADLLNAGRADH